MSRGARAARAPGANGRLRTAFGVVLVGTTFVAAAPAGAFSPRTNYALHCQGCHLADGRETPGLVPKLRGTVGTLAATPAGRDYLVRLPNVAAAPLDDRE
ncbi:MAG: cytochrome C, partial [Alphaproteobacteria bacterium]